MGTLQPDRFPVRPLRLPHRPRSIQLRHGLRAGFAMALALLVGGCEGGPKPPENLQVAIATGGGSDVVVRSSLQRLASQMAAEFMQNNPGTNLHLRFLPEAELLASVRDHTSLGAGPDVLISRVAPMAKLSAEGLVVPSNLSPEELDPLRIQFLPRFRQGNQFGAIPFLLQPSLACYNRERLPKAPATLDALLSRAAEGVRVGLPLEMDELLWSASGFGASQPLLQALEVNQKIRRPLSPTDRTRVLAWLAWLYRANVQPTLQFVDSSDELVQRLATRQLDWISCNATAIPQLRRSLGSRLAVALLPSGPDGQPAEPMARLLLLSFGRDSTPNQRRVAERFALFVLNDFSQNNLMVRAVGNMPVNQNVIVPVKESPQLATMQRSLEASIVPSFHQGIGLRTRTDALRHLLKQDVYGEQPPEKVLQGIEALSTATP
jgi:ABC-type glycerol-3-phosphate transport system substrate-binding protein